MKTTTTVITAYESPNCWVLEIDSQELICTSPSTEGYGLNPNGLSDGDWE